MAVLSFDTSIIAEALDPVQGHTPASEGSDIDTPVKSQIGVTRCLIGLCPRLRLRPSDNSADSHRRRLVELGRRGYHYLCAATSVTTFHTYWTKG